MMVLDKDLVKTLGAHPCFGCRWSGIDPYDWGLRCCNGESTFCTEYCPEQKCEHYEEEEEG
jgi:hypothetical protein